MKLFPLLIGLVLVAATSAKVFLTWSQEVSDDDTTLHAAGPEDGVKAGDILEDVDMASLVQGIPAGAIEGSLQSLDVNGDISSSLDELESSLDAGVCACKGHSCACCYRLNYYASGRHYSVNVCSAVAWASTRFYFRITFNGAQVYHSYVYTSKIVCKRFPHTTNIWACNEMSSVNRSRRSFCLTMADVHTKVNIQVHRCFRFVGDEDVEFPAIDSLA